MKISLKKLKNKIEGEALPTKEHRSNLLSEDVLRAVVGGDDNQGATPTCCPAADDCQD